jgi:hypothetical protein
MTFKVQGLQVEITCILALFHDKKKWPRRHPMYRGLVEAGVRVRRRSGKTACGQEGVPVVVVRQRTDA